tara:strand:- start:358 stop:498 length:141 start_codon:yes stop_codon:yes gene_type:complete
MATKVECIEIDKNMFKEFEEKLNSITNENDKLNLYTEYYSKIFIKV